MVSPELAARLQSTKDEPSLRRAALAASDTAVAGTGLVDARVDRALEILSAGATDTDVRKMMEQFAEELDKRAWDLMDARDDGRVLRGHSVQVRRVRCVVEQRSEVELSRGFVQVAAVHDVAVDTQDSDDVAPFVNAHRNQ